ncbi:uncharacterized protein LOC144331512 [Macaca mulatta]
MENSLSVSAPPALEPARGKKFPKKGHAASAEDGGRALPLGRSPRAPRGGGGGVGASRAGRGGAAPPGLPGDRRALGAGNEEEAGGGSGGGAAAGALARSSPRGRRQPLRARLLVLPRQSKSYPHASFRPPPSRASLHHPRRRRRCAGLRSLRCTCCAPAPRRPAAGTRAGCAHAHFMLCAFWAAPTQRLRALILPPRLLAQTSARSVQSSSSWTKTPWPFLFSSLPSTPLRYRN